MLYPIELRARFGATGGEERIRTSGSVLPDQPLSRRLPSATRPPLRVPMAEGVGFEPTEPCGSAVFKTAALDHSAIPPRLRRSENPSDGDGHGVPAFVPPPLPGHRDSSMRSVDSRVTRT